MRLPSSICPKPEPSSSRNEISCSGRSRPCSAFRRQTSSAVTTPIVPSYLPPLRFESQCEPMPNAGSPRGRLRATSVPTGSWQTSKPSSLELAREVVERVAVDRRVRVAADRLVGERVVGAGERLDVALDALGAPSQVDGHRGGRHAATLISARPWKKSTWTSGRRRTPRYRSAFVAHRRAHRARRVGAGSGRARGRPRPRRRSSSCAGCCISRLRATVRRTAIVSGRQSSWTHARRRLGPSCPSTKRSISTR